MLKLNRTLVLVMLLLPAKLFSQEFSYSARLEKIEESRFHSLTIMPELSAHLHPSLKDLRIVDEKRKPVPYIIKTDLPTLAAHHFETLPIVQNGVKDSGRTHVTLSNETKQQIDAIALFIRNASVSRTAKVSGSDDGRNWFTVIENFSFTGGHFSDSTHFILTLNIPKSSYRYFKVIIDNLNNHPLNIIKAGTYSAEHYSKWLTQRSTITGHSLPNPLPQFIQTDSSDGNSYIKVIQQAPYHVNEIRLEIKAPRFYRRPMEVIIGNTHHHFLLTSSEVYSLPRFAEKEFTIKIFNGDNPPLVISEVLTSQESKQVIAYLEAGKQYSLLMGSPSAAPPSYDLEHFRDSISSVTPISFQGIQANSQSVVKKEDKNNVVLWMIIAVVLAGLCFFTWNLTKEVSKKN